MVTYTQSCIFLSSACLPQHILTIKLNA